MDKKSDGTYIEYHDFFESLHNDSIGKMVKFESNNGISTAKLAQGYWVVVMVSETSNMNNAKVVNISGDNSDVIIDFTTRKE